MYLPEPLKFGITLYLLNVCKSKPYNDGVQVRPKKRAKDRLVITWLLLHLAEDLALGLLLVSGLILI
jgi:hypothetical protein